MPPKPDTALILADLVFSGPLVEWRGPAPYVFIAVPEEHVGEIRYAARLASYGWGVVPVRATVEDVHFQTSLFPRGTGYLLPIKAAVRRAANIGLGQLVAVRMIITASRSADLHLPIS